MDQLLFSVKEAAALLGIAESTLYHLAKDGTVQSVQLRRGRGDVRFRRADLERFLDSLAPRVPIPFPRVPYAVPDSRAHSGRVGQRRALPDPDRVEIEHE